MTIFRVKGARTKRLLQYLRRRAKGKPEKRPAMDCKSFPTLFRKRAIVFTDTADFTMRTAQDGILHFLMVFESVAQEAARVVRKTGGDLLKAEGDSLLIAGPSGTGKSALATQFIAEGLRQGEPGIMAIFEERPEGYTQRASNFGLNLRAAQQKGTLEALYLRPLDLSVDETMQEILDAIKRVGAKRLVIDSLVGFEMALAPGFREDFRESLYRMIGALTGAGITILSTVEVEDSFTELQFSHYAISFLTDDIIRLRYVEIDGQLRKVIVVVKMRGGNHSKDIREYVITNKGVVIIHPRRTDYTGLITGIPQRTGPREAQQAETPPEPKAAK
jgi:circadian clock protein KaiC